MQKKIFFLWRTHTLTHTHTHTQTNPFESCVSQQKCVLLFEIFSNHGGEFKRNFSFKSTIFKKFSNHGGEFKRNYSFKSTIIKKFSNHGGEFKCNFTHLRVQYLKNSPTMAENLCTILAIWEYWHLKNSPNKVDNLSAIWSVWECWYLRNSPIAVEILYNFCSLRFWKFLQPWWRI